jgi:hypothetical protein
MEHSGEKELDRNTGRYRLLQAASAAFAPPSTCLAGRSPAIQGRSPCFLGKGKKGEIGDIRLFHPRLTKYPNEIRTYNHHWVAVASGHAFWKGAFVAGSRNARNPQEPAQKVGIAAANEKRGTKRTNLRPLLQLHYTGCKQNML